MEIKDLIRTSDLQNQHCCCMVVLRAKKVLSDSLGLVDFAIQLARMAGCKNDFLCTLLLLLFFLYNCFSSKACNMGPPYLLSLAEKWKNLFCMLPIICECTSIRIIIIFLFYSYSYRSYNAHVSTL